MRLADLDPSFWSVAGRQGMGVSFNCPGGCCAGKEFPKRLSVPFENPIDGGARDSGYQNYWRRTGETLDALTLHPSVDASHFGHWHGWIRGGEAH